MPRERKVGNLLALAVLSYLTQRPMHPYELGRMLRDHDDARSIKFNHGALYMVFQQLARAGFVAPQETVRDGGRPERTVYALTDTGRAESRDWLRDLVAEPRHEYPQFVAALSLISALPPDDALELLRARSVRLTEEYAAIRTLIDGATAGGVHPLFLAEEEYRLALLDAESAFVDRVIARISDPGSDWRSTWASFHESSTDTSAKEKHP